MAILEAAPQRGFETTEAGIIIPDRLLNPESYLFPNPFNVAIDTDFADPNVLKHNGTLYAFATHTDGQDMQDYILSAHVGEHLLDWDVRPGNALSKPPKWANAYYTWAPFVRYNPDTDLFNMYYSTSIDGHAMGISMAESMFPDHGYEDFSDAPIVGGYPLSADKHNVNRVIDPNVYMRDDGQLMLVYGSAGIPIYEQPLRADGKKVVHNSVPRAILQPREHDYEWRIEAGSVEPNLFGRKRITYAGNDCFGNGVNRYGNYAVMQARFNEETGKFERPTGVDPTATDNVLLEGNFEWKNPGHQDIFTLPGPNGEELAFLITSAIDRANQYHPGKDRKNRRPAIIARVLEKDDWLYIPGGKYPSEERQDVEYFR